MVRIPSNVTDMNSQWYPEEILSSDYDDGTMPANVDQLAEAVIGRRIVSAEKTQAKEPHWRDRWGYSGTPFVITLDNGTRVLLRDTGDCCAYTELEAFLLNPTAVEHAITGVGTTDGFSRWHIYADGTDILELTVGWSCGNPFYYGYGFDIAVEPLDSDSDL